MPDGRPWPRISIVTPNLNNASTLAATIYSLRQNRYGNLEYIVLDAGSSDRSADIIRDNMDIISVWRSEKDDGQYSAVAEGFAKASGEIFAWLNSDDLYFPWTLKVVAEVFSSFPEIDWLIGLPTVYQAGATRRVQPLRPFPRDLILCGLFEGRQMGWIQQESVFWRKSLWLKAGGFDPRYGLASDYYLWRQFAKSSELYALSTPLSGFHKRPGQNRSEQHESGYFSEVDRQIEEMEPDIRERRSRYIRELATFQRWKWLTGVRGLMRRSLDICKVSGNVLTWNDARSRYCLNSVPFVE